jgi:exonuclease I
MVLYHNKQPRLYQKQFQLKKGHYMIYIVILNVMEIIIHINITDYEGT